MAATELTDRRTAGTERVSDYRGAKAVAVYTDSSTEFAALHSSCGVYDLPWRAKIRLSGGDRVRWLNGMITNNVRDLANGHGVYGFVLTPQGRIIGDLYAYQTGDSLLVEMDQEQVPKLLETFDHYIIMDDVEVANISNTVSGVGVAGPRASEILRKVGFEGVPPGGLQFCETNWQGSKATVVCTDSPAVAAYEIWLSPEQVSRLWNSLVEAGATRAGWEALELLRIASGVPRYGVDIRERDLPQETAQDRALNFSKGCYVGQEIVERIRSRGNVHRVFTGFLVEGELPAPGTKIQADGKEVGEITSSAQVSTGNRECKLALGYLRRELATPGHVVTLGESRAQVSTIPFACVFKS